MSYSAEKLAQRYFGETGVQAAIHIGPEDPEGPKMALQGLLNYARLPIKIREAKTKDYAVKVPMGFGSLFRTITIHVEWDARRNQGSVGWNYQHPSMGSNGMNIGRFGLDGDRWTWRSETGTFGSV